MGGCSCIAVDLESHNVRSYYGFTCLIQISLPGGSDYLVDTIALWDHIGDVLGPVFADPDICKVFHACEGGDIAALHRDFRIFCVNVFDTQHAARLLGLPLGLGELLSVTIQSANTAGKTHSTTMSDWRVRPLTPEQYSYARFDTRYLLELRNRLIGRLGGTETEAQKESEMMGILGAASEFGLGGADRADAPLSQFEKNIMNGEYDSDSGLKRRA